MKITFTSNKTPKYNPGGSQLGYQKTEQLSDEQVKEINITRQLPNDLYVKTTESYAVGGRYRLATPSATISIVKYEDRGKDSALAEAKLSKTLPDGYKLVNQDGDTFLLREKDLLEKLQRRNNIIKYVTFGLLALETVALTVLMVRKKFFQK